MSRKRADVKGMFELLHKYRDLLEQAYYDGSICQNDQNRSALYALHAARVIAPRGKAEYRLDRTMRNLIDTFTQRERSFATGGDVGGEIDSMERILEEFERASNEGRMENLRTLWGELEDSIFSIQDIVTQSLLQFRQFAEGSFSDEKNASRKANENEYFLKRAKSLHEVLERLNSNAMHDRFRSPLVGGISDIYRQAISDRMGEWQSALMDLIDIFNRFMFRNRKISEEMRNMRAFSSFLRKRGTDCLEEALNIGLEAAVFRQAPGMAVRPLPDFLSYEGQQDLAGIVSEFDPIERRKTPDRPVGKRVILADVEEAEEEETQEEIALKLFLARVDSAEGWLSSRDWIEHQSPGRSGLFLEEVLSWAVSDRECDRQVRFRKVETPGPVPGNEIIEDIEVCRAA